MEKITTVEQLKTICVAQQEAEKQERVSILVCGGTGRQSSDSQKIVENLRAELAAQGLEDMVEVVRTGCFGFCENLLYAGQAGGREGDRGEPYHE